MPLSRKLDAVGPCGRTVKDAAYILQGIAGKDSYDDATSAIPSIPNYITTRNYNALKGKRIGVPRNTLAGLTEPTVGAFEAALKVLRSAGTTSVDVEYTAFDRRTDYAGEGLAPTYVVSLDFIASLTTYLGQLSANPNDIKDIADVLAFIQTHPREQYPAYPTDNLEVLNKLVADNLTNTGPEFQGFLATLEEIAGLGGLPGALERYSVDAVITPTSWLYDFPTLAGAPLISVPLGSYPAGTPVQSYLGLDYVDPNLPFGISFAGARWKEADLIGYAYAFKQRIKVRNKVKPQIKPKTELWNVAFGIKS